MSMIVEGPLKKEGAEVSEVIIRNLNKEALIDSINMLKKEIDKSQIIMLPGDSQQEMSQMDQLNL